MSTTARRSVTTMCMKNLDVRPKHNIDHSLVKELISYTIQDGIVCLSASCDFVPEHEDSCMPEST